MLIFLVSQNNQTEDEIEEYTCFPIGNNQFPKEIEPACYKFHTQNKSFLNCKNIQNKRIGNVPIISKGFLDNKKLYPSHRHQENEHNCCYPMPVKHHLNLQTEDQFLKGQVQKNTLTPCLHHQQQNNNISNIINCEPITKVCCTQTDAQRTDAACQSFCIDDSYSKTQPKSCTSRAQCECKQQKNLFTESGNMSKILQ